MTANISQFISQIRSSHQWKVGLGILIALAGLVGIYYAWPYLKGNPAGAAEQYTWAFDNTSDVNASGHVTVADGYASVDLVYTAEDFGFHRQITDLLTSGLTHVVAAITDPVSMISGGRVAYSEDLGQTWSDVNIPVTLPTTIQQLSYGTIFTEERIYAGGVTSLGPSKSGVFAYATCGLAGCATTSPDNWSWTTSSLLAPGMQSVGAIETNGLWMVAGVSVGTPATGAIFTANADLDGQASYSGSNILYNYPLLGTSAVNDLFYGPGGGNLYATATSSTGSGKSTIWYTQDQGLNWVQASLSMAESYSHTATYSLTADAAGYIYATTDQGYILKSTTPSGTMFTKMGAGVMTAMAKTALVYQNNLFVFANNGVVYRSVDYDPASGFTSLFTCHPGASGSANYEVVRAVFSPLISTKLILAVNILVPSPVASVVTAVFAGKDISNPETITNTNTLKFSSISSLEMTLPLSSAGAQPPRFRLTNHAGGQWYYYDDQAGQWRISYSTASNESNTLAEVNTGIAKFAEQLGQGEFYYQLIFPSAFDLQPIVVDAITVNYANDFAVTKVDPEFGSAAGEYDVNITGDGFTRFTNIKFGQNDSSDVQFVSSTQLITKVPKSTLPGDGSGSVDVFATDVNNGFSYDGTPLVGGFTYYAGIGSIQVSVPAYTALNTDFELTVTMLNENGDPMTSFHNPVAIGSASMVGGGGSGVISPNSIGDIQSDWNNGSATGTFQMNQVGSWMIIASYTDVQPYSGFDNTSTVDVDQEPVASFEVQVIPSAEQPNTNFRISLTAYAVGHLVKTNFISPVTLKADANGDGIDDGYLDPAVIGDGNEGGSHGIWNLGKVAYNNYQISQPGTYSIIANYGDQDLGHTDMTIGGLTIPSIIPPLDPDHGPANGGTPVIITGIHFGNIWAGGKVLFGGLSATITNWSDNSILVTSPPSLPGLSMPVKVVRPDGQVSIEPVYFTYDEGPRIDQLDPDNGPISGGTLVTITGSNFGGIETGSGQVDFGALPAATIVNWNDNSISVLSPAVALSQTVLVKVTTAGDLISNEVAYTYTAEVSDLGNVRYYSPIFTTTELANLNSIAIIADGYSQDFNGIERVDIGIGLFKDRIGSELINPLITTSLYSEGYAILYNRTDYNMDADNAAILATLSQMPGFSEVRYLRFRIHFYGVLQPAPTITNPWVESINLEVTAAVGTVGHIEFDNVTSRTISETNPTTAFDMHSISDLSGIPGSYNIKLDLAWKDGHAPAGVTPTIIPDTITSFSSLAIVYPFQVQFDGTGAVFDGSAYQFQITGVDQNNSNIILEPMTIYGTLTLQAPPSFKLRVLDADKVVVQGGSVNFDVTVTGQDGFSGAVILTDDAAAHFATGRITSNVFNPNPVAILDGVIAPVPSTLTLQTASLAGIDLNKWVTFTISGADFVSDTEGTLHDAITVRLYILSQAVPNDEFALIITNPDKEAQPDMAVSYDIEAVYGADFTGDITLSTNAESVFTDVTATFVPPILFGSAITTDILLTLTIGPNPGPSGVLDVATAFTITGTAGTLEVNATPNPSLLIHNTVANPIEFQLTIPVQGILSNDPVALAPKFTFRLYAETETANTNWAISLVDLVPTNQDPATATVTISDIQIARDLLVDGATYIAYVRSNRHLWAKAILPTDGKVQVDFSQTNLVSFPKLLAGDIAGLGSLDNVVDLYDFTYVLGRYNQVGGDLVPDFDANGLIDLLDMSYIFQNFNRVGDTFFNQ